MKIIEFDKKYAKDFEALNLAWLKAYFVVEQHDTEVLGNPKSYIIDNGGFIFFAIENDRVIGTAALMNEPHGWELSKMAVSDEFQGRGIGQKLLDHCISFSRHKGWESIMLYSNRKLENAIHLYFKNGFKELDMEKDTPYDRADIKMELKLH